MSNRVELGEEKSALACLAVVMLPSVALRIVISENWKCGCCVSSVPGPRFQKSS